jgi:hypothetical protein
VARTAPSTRTDRILALLQTRGVQRGIFGSSRGWFWVAVLTWGLRRVRRSISEPQIVFRGELKPGQALQIDHLDEVYGEPRRRRWGRRG